MKRLFVMLCCAGLAAGCLPTPESAMGFRLPEGNADRGGQAYEDLGCRSCHRLRGEPAAADESLATEQVVLGRDVGRVQTYGELVTSLINPSHRLAPGYEREAVTVEGESRMALASLNEAMTVQQLIDLVAFLQPRYEVHPPDYDPYLYIYPTLGRQ